MSFGITESGFTPMRLPDIKAALETELVAVFGEINLEPTSVFGQFVGVMSKICADWWEGLEDVYLSQYPSTAGFAALDNVVMLTGITRLAAVKSTVTCQLTGVASTAVPAGSQIANTEGDLFELVAEVIIPGDGEFESVETGAIPVVAETLTTIVTPVSGWEGVDNTDAGVTGRDEETDAELRIRRETSLAIIGAGTVESIQSRIINEIAEVTSCRVYENTSDTTVDDRPPHSIEIVVIGGDDQEIAELIWQVKPAGIQLYHRTAGGVTETITDSNGDTQTIYFTRPTTKYLHVKVDITSYNSEETFPIDGEDQIKAAILSYVTPAVAGKNIVIQRWNVPVFEVSGIGSFDVEHALTVNPGDTPSYVTTDIVVPATEIAELSLSRITVNL